MDVGVRKCDLNDKRWGETFELPIKVKDRHVVFIIRSSEMVYWETNCTIRFDLGFLDRSPSMSLRFRGLIIRKSA